MPSQHVLMLESLSGRHLAHMRSDSLCRLMRALKAATQRVEEEMARRQPSRYARRLAETAGRRSLEVFVGVVLAAGLMFALPSGAQASPCKGLEEAACTSSASCRWMPERRAGEKSKADKVYELSVKAHCRACPRAKAAGEAGGQP